MISLFKAPVFRDSQFGELSRSRGRWRGHVDLAAGTRAPLILSGGRAEPDPEALALARQAVQQYASWRREIETALYDHFSPYAEAVEAGEEVPGEPLPKIAAPGQVWPHVTLEYVAVTPLDGILTTEVGYTTAWDEEHTLGARFQSGRFVELNGSVLRP